MCRHIYDWNIVNCDVKQQIQLNSTLITYLDFFINRLHREFPGWYTVKSVRIHISTRLTKQKHRFPALRSVRGLLLRWMTSRVIGNQHGGLQRDAVKRDAPIIRDITAEEIEYLMQLITDDDGFEPVSSRNERKLMSQHSLRDKKVNTKTRHREKKGRDLTRSYDKSPYTHRKIQKAAWQGK